jgi:hypothetical protein
VFIGIPDTTDPWAVSEADLRDFFNRYLDFAYWAVIGSPFGQSVIIHALPQNGGDKLVHGSGGRFPVAGGVKSCHL